MGDKEKLRFKIQDTQYGYEGVNTPQARQKDLMEFMVKMKLDTSAVVPTFRQNLPELAGTSDADILQLFSDAVEKRKKKDAAKKAAKAGAEEAPAQPPAAAPSAAASSAAPATPPVEEEMQKLTISFQGKAYSYEGQPSKRAEALCDFLIKQVPSDQALMCATWRENFVGTAMTDAQILEQVEERKRIRAERKKSKSGDKSEKSAAAAPPAAASSTVPQSAAAAAPAPAAQVAPAPAQAVAPKPTSPAPSQAQVVLNEIPDAQKDSIYSFIRGVLDTPSVDIAATLKAVPASHAVGAASASVSDPPPSHAADGKVAVYCQEAGATTSKMVYVQPTKTNFEEMMAVVEKKFGKRMCLAFFEGEDKIEIDDDDVLQMFFEQDIDKKTKLRLMVAPIGNKRKVADDQLTDVVTGGEAGAAAAATAAANSPAKNDGRTVKHTELNSFSGHTAAIYCCAWSPKGDKFCTSSRDKSVRVWNVADNSSKVMKGGHNGLVLSCDFSPNGEHIVSSSEDSGIKIWNIQTGAKIAHLKGHENKVYCVQYNPTGAYIVSGSCDCTVRVWNADTASKITVLKGHTLPIFSCCFSTTDGGKLVASGSDDRLIKIWDWAAGKEIRSLVGHTGTVWSCKFSHNDKLIVSTSMDHVINVWNVATGAIIRSMGGHATPIHHAIFTKDDRFILSCARDWSVRAWETDTGNQVGLITGHSNTVFHMDLFGDQLITSSLDATVKLWKIEFPH